MHNIHEISKITSENIFKNCTSRSTGGYQTVLTNNRGYYLSIVGGSDQLHGDFINGFEVAVVFFDKKNLSSVEFITKTMIPTANDDVISHATIDEINDIVEIVFRGEDPIFLNNLKHD